MPCFAVLLLVNAVKHEAHTKHEQAWRNTNATMTTHETDNNPPLNPYQCRTLEQTWDMTENAQNRGTNQASWQAHGSYNITKGGLRVLLLDECAIRLTVKEEAGHVALGLVRILVLLGALLLHLDNDFLLLGGVLIGIFGFTHF